MDYLKSDNLGTGNPIVVLLSIPFDNQDYHQRSDVVLENLEVGYAYAALQEKGIPTTIVDSTESTAWFSSPVQEIKQQILNLRPKYLVLFESIQTISTAVSLVKLLKSELHDLVIIFDGLHSSLFYKEILESVSCVDYVVYAESPLVLPLLVKTLESEGSVYLIPGLAYRKNSRVEVNPPEFVSDIDTLPFPHRSKLTDNYLVSRSYYNLVGSRGCPGHCTFCSKSSWSNKYCKDPDYRWRGRSPENVLDEMKQMHQKGVRRFLFFDDNWIGHKEPGIQRILQLCRLIKKNGMEDISYSAMMRPDSLSVSDSPAIQTMKDSGLSVISMGLEAGNESQLRIFGKKYEIESVVELVDLLHRSEIMVRCGFIMFFPYSTFDMLRANAAFIHRLGLSFQFEVFFGELTAFSAMSIEKRLKRDGLVEKPTTFESPGSYHYRDPRIKDLQRCILSILLPERQFVYEMLIVGEQMCSNKRKTGDFESYQNVVGQLGQATHDLFRIAIDAFESVSSTTEAIRECRVFSQKWIEELETTKQKVREYKMYKNSWYFKSLKKKSLIK